METLSYRVQLRFVKILNVILVTIPIIAYCNTFYSMNNGYNDKGGVSSLYAVLFMLLYMTYGRIYDSFLVSLVRISEMIYSQCLAILMSDVLLLIIFSLIARHFVNVFPLIIMFAFQLFISICWCVCTHLWYFAKFPPRKTAVIYDQKQNVDNLIATYGLSKKFYVEKVLDVNSCIDDQFAGLAGIETIFLCGVHSHDRNNILKYCINQNIVVYVLPRIGDIIMSGAKRIHLFRMPFLRVNRYDPPPEYLFVKRLFDIAVSFLALLATSPIMMITAFAIKATDGGPVLYKQKRLTKNGREFYVLKFRSMCQDAEKDGIARLSTGESDNRITPVGRIMRKFRIDELPQLINILQGNMSIVGPRPERPEIAQQYEKELPEFSLRLQAKAGLTGYAQVYGKYNTTPYDKLQMDLMYIAHPSFWEDIRIIFATVKILFLPESTEGVEEGMETAMEKESR